MTPEAQTYLNNGGTLINGQIPTANASTPGNTPAQQDALKAGAANSYDFKNTITSATTAPQPNITLPASKPDTTDYTSHIAGANASIDARNQQIKDTLKAEYPNADSTTLDAMFNSFVNSQVSETGPNNAGAYDTATGTTEAQRNQAVLDAKQAQQALKSQVNAKQAQVAGYQAQIKSITDQRDAQNLQLEQTINEGTTGVGGAGAMASGSFLNVRQQEINRQAAIKALPLQGLAAAAQAELLGLQGRASEADAAYKDATTAFDKAFQLKIDDNNKIYEAQAANRKSVYDFLTAAQKNIADNLDKTQASNLSQSNAAINDANQAGQSLLATQPDLYNQIYALPHPDPLSKTFAADLQTYQSKVAAILAKATPKVTSTAAGAAGSLEEFKSLYGRNPTTIAELNAFSASRKASETNPQTQVVEIGGRKLLIDQTTGKTIKDLGAATTGGTKSTQEEQTNSAITRFEKVFVAGAKLPNGIPILDSSGQMTPEGWIAAIKDAPNEGMSRERFIKEFGHFIVDGQGKVSTRYGLTPAEIKLMGAESK